MAAKKHATPICPECGSAACEVVEDDHVCKRCHHVGTLTDFTRHTNLGSLDPDTLVTQAAVRHYPRLADEEIDDGE